MITTTWGDGVLYTVLVSLHQDKDTASDPKIVSMKGDDTDSGDKQR